MDPITIMVIGVAVLGLAAWGIVSLVDPRRRTPRSIESEGEATGRRSVRLIGLLLACGLILGGLLYFSR